MQKCTDAESETILDARIVFGLSCAEDLGDVGTLRFRIIIIVNIYLPTSSTDKQQVQSYNSGRTTRQRTALTGFKQVFNEKEVMEFGTGKTVQTQIYPYPSDLHQRTFLGLTTLMHSSIFTHIWR